MIATNAASASVGDPAAASTDDTGQPHDRRIGPATLSDDRGYALAVFAFLLFSVIATMPWWWDGRVVPWDARNHFYPMLRWLASSLHEHGWPGFMREIFAGRPVLGDPQSMVLSPGFLLLGLLDPTPSMRAMDLLILVELGLAGLALMALARLKGIHPAVALLAAMVTAFGGVAMARLQHTLLVQSYAFVPVVLLALEVVLRRPTLLRGALFGVALGLLAVGRDHVAFLGLIMVAGWALAHLASREGRLRFLARRLPAFLIAGGVASAVALPPVLATMGFAEISNRPAFGVQEASVKSLPPAALVTLVSANYFGNLYDYQSYWGPGTAAWPPKWSVDRTTIQLFAGTAVAVLLLWLGLLRGFFARQGNRFAAVAFVLLLLYAFGRHTPAFAVFFAIPGVDLFRRPADAAFLMNLAVALGVLAVGHSYLINGLAPLPRWRVFGECGLALAALVAAVGLAVGREALWSAAVPLALTLAVGAATVAALLWGARGTADRRLLVLLGLAGVTAVELTLFSTGTLLNAHAPDRYVVQETPETDPLARHLVERVAALEAEHGPTRVEMLGLGGAWQNMSLVLRIENTLGYNPLRYAAYDAATGARQNSHRPERTFGTLMSDWTSPFADLLGVRLLVLGKPLAAIDPRSAGAFGPPERVGKAYLYERKTALPRVLLVSADRVRPHEDDALLSGRGTLPDLDWRTEALVDSPGTGVADGAASAVRRLPSRESEAVIVQEAVRILSYTPTILDVGIAPAVPSFLILHELRAPGWTATVDGQRRPLHPANTVFQAVAVAPGDRRVRFVYRPQNEIWAGLP